jgi:hypothetical protein
VLLDDENRRLAAGVIRTVGELAAALCLCASVVEIHACCRPRF